MLPFKIISHFDLWEFGDDEEGFRGEAMRQIVRGQKSGNVSVTRSRSYQLSLVDLKGLRINLISSGQNLGGFPARVDVQHSPSCRCCCFLLCISSHQADCSPPQAVKGMREWGQIKSFCGFTNQNG